MKTIITPPNDVAVYGCEIATFWKKDGIIYSVGKKIKRNPTNVEKFVSELKKLVSEGKALFIADLTNTQTYSREEKKIIHEKLLPISRAIALVSGSPMGKMLARTIFLKGKGSSVPVGEFETESQAVDWLKDIKKDQEAKIH